MLFRLKRMHTVKTVFTGSHSLDLCQNDIRPKVQATQREREKDESQQFPQGQQAIVVVESTWKSFDELVLDGGNAAKWI